MVISKRLLLSLVALAMAGTGLAMYLGMQLGIQAASSDAPPPETIPVASTASHDLWCDHPEEQRHVRPAAVEEPETDQGEGDSGGGDQSEEDVEVGDFATNSGTIDGSQFSDGGFGDLGQQWWNVVVNGHVTSVVVTENGTADVNVGDDAYSPPVVTPTTILPVADAEGDTTTTTAPPTTTTVEAPPVTAPTTVQSAPPTTTAATVEAVVPDREASGEGDGDA